MPVSAVSNSGESRVSEAQPTARRAVGALDTPVLRTVKAPPKLSLGGLARAERRRVVQLELPGMPAYDASGSRPL